jgi:hypothetical protein
MTSYHKSLGRCSTLLMSTECSTLQRYDEADSILVGEQRGRVCFTDDETDDERPSSDTSF